MILYHSHHLHNLKYSSGENTGIGRVYASDNLQFTSAFTPKWLQQIQSAVNISDVAQSAQGYINIIKYTQYANVGISQPWKLSIPQKYESMLYDECSIYKVSTVNFKRDLSISEGPVWVSYKPVKLLEETKFKTCLDCMNYYGLIVEVI